MLAHLRARGGLRAIVAMTTAYVVALQMLLAAVLTAPMALAAASATDLFVICHSDGTASGKDTSAPSAPVQHDACAVCVQAHSMAAAAEAAPAMPVRRVSYARFASAEPGAPAGVRHHDPRSSQGPPRNV